MEEQCNGAPPFTSASCSPIVKPALSTHSWEACDLWYLPYWQKVACDPSSSETLPAKKHFFSPLHFLLGCSSKLKRSAMLCAFSFSPCPIDAMLQWHDEEDRVGLSCIMLQLAPEGHGCMYLCLSLHVCAWGYFCMHVKFKTDEYVFNFASQWVKIIIIKMPIWIHSSGHKGLRGRFRDILQIQSGVCVCMHVRAHPFRVACADDSTWHLLTSC